MKKTLYLLFLLLTCFSCEQEKLIIGDPAQSTVVMFFPWSSNLKSYFDQNIKDFASAVTSEGLYNERVIVCIESKPDYVDMIEMKSLSDGCKLDTLFSYSNAGFTTERGLTKLFTTMRTITNTDTYSLIIGCHGMGWLPIDWSEDETAQTKAGEFEKPITRYFGGLTNEYKIEISTLAQGLKNADLKLEYLLFDDCYMSSIEAAYELKDVTHYLIACPTEVMAYGFPYQYCGKYLLGEPDYENVCKSFYNFYRNYESPYGTIAVTDCSELDNLAEIVRQINEQCPNEINISNVQQMDGYTPPIFYDLADVVHHQCTNVYLTDRFDEEMLRVVPYSAHTSFYYTAAKGPQIINNFSGITTSVCSTNKRAASATETAWYQATH